MLPLGCKGVENRCFLTRFLGELGDTSNFGHALSNHTSKHVAGFG